MNFLQKIKEMKPVRDLIFTREDFEERYLKVFVNDNANQSIDLGFLTDLSHISFEGILDKIDRVYESVTSNLQLDCADSYCRRLILLSALSESQKESIFEYIRNKRIEMEFRTDTKIIN